MLASPGEEVVREPEQATGDQPAHDRTRAGKGSEYCPPPGRPRHRGWRAAQLPSAPEKPVPVGNAPPGNGEAMKLAISGKGGVGKTTLSSLLAIELAGRGFRVTAIDADPNPGLATMLGLPPGRVPSLLDLRDEIEARVGGAGGFIRLNPRVDDLVERLAVTHRGVQLIVAGAISRGGGGCACPQSVLLRRLLDHLVLDRDEAIIVDLEAGLEHLGRRSAQAADALLVVVDPSRGSLDTAGRIRRLAAEIGVSRVLAVANRIRSEADLAYVHAHLGDLPLVASIPYSTALAEGERHGSETTERDPAAADAVAGLTDELESRRGWRVGA